MKSVPCPTDDPHQAIRSVIAGIPRGRVASYGEIATRAGLPGRARLVGRILRDSDADAGLPWHRVVRADGRPAFAPRSRSFLEQKRKLAAEGVPITGSRVDLRRFGWQRDVDAELWAPREESNCTAAGG